MTGTLRVSRSRGAMSGVLLVLLGAWGGLIPLVGPYAHFAYTPDRTWVLTSGRIWLEIAPGAAALLGGLILLASRLRPAALLGASIAAAAGAWFAIGPALAPLWTTSLPAQGNPIGGLLAQAVEQISFFTGLGIVIAAVASMAIGRLSLVSVRDHRIASRASEALSPSATDSSHATSPAVAADTVTTSRLTVPGRRVASSAGVSTAKGQDASQAADVTSSR